MSQITIGGTTLKFKDSAFTGDQWEQVASWVLNGGAEGIDANAQIATEKAAAASASAASARNSATSAGESATAAANSATSAAESIKHAPRINADGKWELWDATTNAYVATEYTAIGEDGVRGRGWYQHNVGTSLVQAVVWDGSIIAPKWGKGDWLYNPDNGNVGLCTSRTDNADGSGSANINYKGTLKGTDGITPHIGENGNWYLGATDTGEPSRGADGDTAKVNGKTPDENGEITLDAADIKCSDGTDVNAAINARVNKDGSSTTAFSFGYDAGGLYVVTP